jgi:phosphosulfolactate synthase (CoM biosynthesis protein A)
MLILHVFRKNGKLSVKLVAIGTQNLPQLAREGKPRDKGLTLGTDQMKILDRGLLEQSAEYLDTVKIGKSLPLLLDRARLVDRIRYYHDLGIKVQSGGTLIQVAFKKKIVSQVQLKRDRWEIRTSKSGV